LRLFNRAAQRYLLRRRKSGPVVGIPGSDMVAETDWRLIEFGDMTAILSSSEPGLYLRPEPEGVTVETASKPADAAWWEVQPAEGDFRFIVAAGNPKRALATELSKKDDLTVVTKQAHDRSAMWLIQPQCVADARSVHLRYETPPGISLFYNEIAVEQAPPGTFFCMAGFGTQLGSVAPSGYGGIQHRADGSRLAIFSVWHRMADQATSVPGAGAIVLGAAPRAEMTLFSGEGSGSSIRLPFQWIEDGSAPVRFVITAERLGSDTAIAAYVAQGSAPWLHLGVILRAETGGALLSHPYAFIEDFLRNGNTPSVAAADRSPYRMRSAVFRNPWFALSGQMPVPVRTSNLTAYSPHPLEGIAAVPTSPGQFGLRVATGTGIAIAPPPIGARFTDEVATRQSLPYLGGVPRD